MRYLVSSDYEIKKYKDLIILKFKWCYENIFPGQFFMIGAEDSGVLLNRPFSISDFSDEILTFRVRVSGKFTTFLRNLDKKSQIRLIGPLGNYLELDLIKKFDKVILIGGGIGIAPLIYFSNYLKKLNIDNILIYGCQSKDYLHYAIFENKNHPIIFTEDGSVGFKGYPTSYLKYFKKEDNILVIACGPNEMYKSLKNFLNIFQIKVLLEQKMACGFGVCLGCVINTKNGFFHVCKEGPVCDLKYLEFD